MEWVGVRDPLWQPRHCPAVMRWGDGSGNEKAAVEAENHEIIGFGTW